MTTMTKAIRLKRPTLTLALALTLALILAPLLAGTPAVAADGEIILPQPDTAKGVPLMEALAKRHSTRAFQAVSLTPQQLSEILWSAFGVNREGGGRVIPSFHGRNELAVYAVLASGVYLYDPPGHKLALVLEGDFTLDYGGAPLTLLYAGSVLDGPVGGMHVGSAYQGVGLYCASEGLANVVKASGVNILDGKLTPPDDWKVLVVQSIGQPAE
jgi:hypothetical protein